jgi:uncharacterized YigZ family protein
MKMLTKYYTVNKSGTAQLVIQKSRFIGYIRRVETEQAALEFIAEIKKKHYDATHNCSAYMIGQDDKIQKANDDGEPSGTAGIPMLEVLKRQNLKNTAVVVTRYFGGIKLGAGGLIRAYGSMTSEAIKATGIVQCILVQRISVVVDYTMLGKLENEIRQSEYILDAINYLEYVEFTVYVNKDDINTFRKWMVDLTNDQAIITDKEFTYIEKNVSSTKGH